MNVFLWTVAGPLALVFGAAGAMKLGRTGQQPAASDSAGPRMSATVRSG